MSSTQYGIGVTKNRFELFGNEDDDPIELLKRQELEKEERKKTKPSEKENKVREPTPKPKPVAPKKLIKDTQNLKPLDSHVTGQVVDGRPARLEKNEKKLNTSQFREDRSIRRSREEHQNTSFQQYRQNRGERFDRREGRFQRGTTGYPGENGEEFVGRGRGGSLSRPNYKYVRGGRGGQRPTFDIRGKRGYDRQSGSDKTEMQNNPANDEALWSNEKPETSAQGTNEAVAEGEEVTAAAAEDALTVLTLDEWKALHTPRQKPTYNIRKPGEGEDLAQWKKMYALQKKKEEEEDDEYEYEIGEYPQRVGRQKHVLNIDIHFKDKRNSFRGRGGRGGPRVGPRAPPASLEISDSGHAASPKIAPKVDDEQDFPSLGLKK